MISILHGGRSAGLTLAGICLIHQKRTDQLRQQHCVNNSIPRQQALAAQSQTSHLWPLPPPGPQATDIQGPPPSIREPCRIGIVKINPEDHMLIPLLVDVFIVQLEYLSRQRTEQTGDSTYNTLEETEKITKLKQPYVELLH